MSRREYIKTKKQAEQKKKSEIIEITKKEKAEERMHRIIIKGRNPMQHILAGKEEKKKKNKLNLSKDDEDTNMLHFDESD
jgi:hypothetical protein